MKTSEPAAILQIRIARAMITSLSQLASERSMSVEAFLSQLAEGVVADHRQRQNAHLYDEPLGPPTSEAAEPREDEIAHRMPPAVVQKMIFLRSQGHTVAQLSRRFNCSPSTVRRICANFDHGQHVHLNASGGHNARRGAKRQWSISFEENAEAAR